MKKSIAIKLAFAGVIFFASIANANAQVFSIDSHETDFTVIQGSFESMPLVTGMVLEGNNVCASNTFYSWACAGQHPATVGDDIIYYSNIEELNALPVGSIIYFCETNASECPSETDPTIALTIISAPVATNNNLWFRYPVSEDNPTGDFSLTASANNIGQITSGTISNIWPFLIIAIALGLVFNVFIPRTRDLVPKDTDKDAQIKATRAVTEHMRSEKRGDKIVRDLTSKK